MRLRLAFASLAFPCALFAWGHQMILATEWKEASLAHKTLAHQEIRYCVELIPRLRGWRSQISFETKLAIQLWLKAAKRKARVKEVACQTPVDLRVQMGPESEYPELSSYAIPRFYKGKYEYLIRLNTQYGFEDAGKKFKIRPVAFSPSEREQSDITHWNFRNRKTYLKFYFSTYNCLIHEVGHAFGLCDTAPSLYPSCDSKHESAFHGEGVMNTSESLLPSEDDKKGIRSVFARLGSR